MLFYFNRVLRGGSVSCCSSYWPGLLSIPTGPMVTGSSSVVSSVDVNSTVKNDVFWSQWAAGMSSTQSHRDSFNLKQELVAEFNTRVPTTVTGPSVEPWSPSVPAPGRPEAGPESSMVPQPNCVRTAASAACCPKSEAPSRPDPSPSTTPSSPVKSSGGKTAFIYYRNT